MQLKKDPVAPRQCRNCGASVRGKYAMKNHVCDPRKVAEFNRSVGLAAQRKERTS